MTIKVLEKTEGCMPEAFKVGDWYDLKLAEDVRLRAPYAVNKYTRKGEAREYQRNVHFNTCLARLGVCMQLPKGYEAVVVPRSSTFGKCGVMQTNHVGVIDNLYCGDTDEWLMPMMAMRDTFIPKGTRIAQFRVQLSQRATIWQKLGWLLSGGIKFVKVDSLDNPSRGGFGSTGEK